MFNLCCFLALLRLLMKRTSHPSGHSPTQTPRKLKNQYPRHTGSACNKFKLFNYPVISIKVLNNKPEAKIKGNEMSCLNICIYVDLPKVPLFCLWKEPGAAALLLHMKEHIKNKVECCMSKYNFYKNSYSPANS